jgi:hypothetical protein
MLPAHCASSCQLVYVEAEDTASDGELTCLQCDGSLPGRDGSFIRKYFLVDRKRRRRSKSRHRRTSRSNTHWRSPEIAFVSLASVGA